MLDAGVDVGMVQIGNEINYGMCGETKTDQVNTLLKSGSKAVREVSGDYDKQIDIVVHYTRIVDKGDVLNLVAGLVDSGLDFDMIREAAENDLKGILELYLFLHEKEIPEETEQLKTTWEQIIKDDNHHLIVCEIDGKIVASCVCVIIPNLTRGVRPYAFVENVVTHGDYRNKGYATDCLNYAKKIAEENNCYKMMLLTGSKEEKTLDFYEHAGYNSSDKTAFIHVNCV